MKHWVDPALVATFGAEKTDAYRLGTTPDGWVERFGDAALVSYKTDPARAELLADLAEWERLTEQPFARVFGRFLPKQNAERVAPQLLRGDASLPLEQTVLERGICYSLDFGAGYSAGLFLDQRENRQFVRRLAPRRTLNCFAYTCSFSVVAALGGGATMSVDLSRKSLDRGRDNFMLNRVATDQHRFLADDVLRVLPRLARKGETFDCIILDPPTFSRSHTGKSWQIERDFEDLVLAALAVATRDARILLSTNCTRLDARALEVMARFCLKATRRAGNLQAGSRPADFPPGSGARTLWMLLR